MRVTPEEYSRIDLRAHSLLAGVPLHDVWAVDLPGRGNGRTIEDLRALLAVENLRAANPAVNLLFAVRTGLGRVFGWDRTPARASEASFLHRLSAADRASSLVAPGTSEGPFRVLFVSAREAISEIHNPTVHAFSVFALVERSPGHRLYWGIYVQPVGRITAWYMRLIDPFRRFIIYPAVLRYVREAWARDEPRRPPNEMRKLGLGLVIAPLAYLAAAAVLHYAVLREGPVPEAAYPRAGAVYWSEVEGLESHVISQANGRDLKRVRVRPGAAGPPEHVHLELEEDFHLLEGELVVVLDGAERVVTAGEWARVPPRTRHRFFNRSDAPAVYELDAPRSHTLFTSQVYGFTNAHGALADHPARALLQMSRFRPDSWRPALPIGLQRMLYFSVEPTARLLGYRRFYPEYVPEAFRGHP